jgi:hypothetical protein
MGVHLYQKTTSAEGIVSLSHVQSVRLSGSDGIVSKFIKSNPNEDLEQWTLNPGEIAELLGQSSENKALIFSSHYESTGNPSVSLIKTLSGKSSIMETELLMMMQPIENIASSASESDYPKRIEYPEKQKLETFFESILIKGGVSKLNHSWKLAPPKMQIGGVIR